jgi:hypothetical protein
MMNASERRARDQRIISRRKKKAAWLGYEPVENNRWNKFSCGGCGNTKCYKCHPEKLSGKPTRQEIIIQNEANDE